jgi:predicted alpha-1,2-mannosidase
LQKVFDDDLYDPSNEPDIAYPYLFSQFKGEEWRTQKEVSRLLSKYFTNKPEGIPGNDDTGTMSAWAIFSMMGFYPDCPGKPEYTITTPTFDKITIQLNPEFYNQKSIVLKAENRQPGDNFIKEINLDGKKLNKFSITHEQLTNTREISFDLKANHK